MEALERRFSIFVVISSLTSIRMWMNIRVVLFFSKFAFLFFVLGEVKVLDEVLWIHV